MGGPGARRLRQRGAALLDLVVGAAAALMIFSLLVAALHALVLAAATRHAVMTARTQTDAFLERMRSDTSSAWSVFVPPSDLRGSANTDGHEVDMVLQDATRRVFHVAYLFDANADSVTRYLLAPGVPPEPGDAATGITRFTAVSYPATAVTDASSEVYDPLFAGVAVTPVAYTLPDGTVAGNAVVSVNVRAAGTLRSELLETTIAPTQFTIVVQYTPPP